MKKNFVVISYDLSDDKRRTKIHKALKAYGERIQYSIFECSLDNTLYAKLKARLNPLIDADEDSIRFYHLCESCKSKVERIGGIIPSEDDDFII